ncbi:MAG: beta-glucosidase BglX [Flammeovirgaceae bacterium]|nr:beta-glucosidase BglX [Flammeovirgaceae bacterium]MBE61801.1 beta-glucosidase BglX [Flammeovirgaceae bacterium]HCX23092.1 beta-glucosidase BglX [Cytophagales bacterium]
MRYKILAVLLMVAMSSHAQKLSEEQISKKVDSLLSIMTISEKVGQTNMYNGTWEFTGPVPEDTNNQLKADNINRGYVGGMLNVLTAEATREAQRMAVENSRLGIPLIFGYDVIHGYKTMLPVPLAQSASWDFEGVKRGTALAAQESSASGLHWTFSPMIDVSWDARWGRIMEGAGEDPYLTSVMAKAWVEGYQGDDLSSPLTIAACAKHFAGYAFAEAGRDYNTADVSLQTLYNVILPPFKAAVDAGAATFMNSFNEIGGVPATADEYLQRDILKGKWGFDGFMVSDWGSIGELLTHGYAQDSAHAGLLAFKAGSDMDMEARIYEFELQTLVESGAVNMELLDDAVRRILTIKYRLGLFEDPYKYSNPQRESELVFNDKTRTVAREVARSTMVLLKNENNLLPLSKNVGSIAVIGQLAGSKDIPLGNWRAQAIANSAVSLEEGIRNVASSKTKVNFAQGYTITEGRRDFIHELNWADDNGEDFEEAINLAKKSDVVVLALGEDCYQTGEGRSQADIGLKGKQLELFNKLLAVNKNVVVVLMNGRPLAIPEVAAKAPAILETWFAGSESGNAIADVLFGDYNPSGKLPVTFPVNVGQEPLHYDRKNTGRPVTNAFDNGLVFWSHYTDSPNEGVYPFGYGLSYSNFKYSELQAEPEKGKVSVRITLTNQSKVEGKETVQVYIRDRVASLTQPIKRLVDFKQVVLKAGESQVVQFELTKEDLGFYNTSYEFVAEDGAFDIMVGPDSQNLKKETITLTF